MTIGLDKNGTLNTLKKKFANQFANLKIEFFESPHSNGEASPMSEIVAENTKLIDLIKPNADEQLLFSEKIKIFALEKIFEENFGLNAQVFRKSGDDWIQTTVSDNWSLEDIDKYNK